MEASIKKYIEIVNEETSCFFDSIDEEALNDAKELILNAEDNNNRLHVTGIGKPGHVSAYAASLFSSTGTPAYELNGTEAVHGSSGQIVSGDVVIAISNSGETQELKATVRTLKNNGGKIIAVTGNENSWLAQNGNVALIASVEQEGDDLNKPPRASILVEVMILQILSVMLQNAKGLTPKQYVKWHPGGAIGESLKN